MSDGCGSGDARSPGGADRDGAEDLGISFSQWRGMLPIVGAGHCPFGRIPPWDGAARPHMPQQQQGGGKQRRKKVGGRKGKPAKDWPVLSSSPPK